MPPRARVGRPLKFKSAVQMETKIKDYFSKCELEDRPYTITGLAISLGLDRKGLIDYEGRTEFRQVIKGAKAKVEEQVEKLLLTSKNQAGAIFWLKNFGWTDKQQIEVSEYSNMSKEDLVNKLRMATGNKPLGVLKSTTEKRKSSGLN